MPEVSARDHWIRNRVNLPTAKSSAEIVRDIPPDVRARSFFSARVAEAHILERFRAIEDDYLNNKIGRDEARHLMRQYAVSSGKDDGTRGLKNLASTARLNLIIDQNAKMAKAVGDYERMYDPANIEAFPYVIYRASVGSKVPRGEHKRWDGMILEKNDPWLRSHWPPSEFGCNCELENCTAKKAGKYADKIKKPSPPEAAKQFESRSGFAFDPADGLGTIDLSNVRSPEVQGNIRESAEIEFGDQVSFVDKKAILTSKTYKNFADESLPSAKEWEAAPSPKRILPAEAQKKLEDGFEVEAGDGRKVVMDQAVLDHWTVENNKLPSDVESRLACLDYAVETLKHPNERWDQETQSRYLKKFQKTTGGYEGCMVVVTQDGKCRTYFLPNVTKLDKSRTGIGYKIIEKVESSTGSSATQTTEAIVAPDDSDDRNNNNTPESGKVKKISPDHRKTRVDIRQNAWSRRVDKSALPESIKKELKGFDIREMASAPKLVLSKDVLARYDATANVIQLSPDAPPEYISHEMTHAWQWQMQKKNSEFSDEIRSAQEKDWDRLKKVWGSKVKDYSLDSLETQKRLAQEMFGVSDFSDLNSEQEHVIHCFLDSAGSVSGGKVGGWHGDKNDGGNRKKNKDYFFGLDRVFPAQEAVANIRAQVQYGDDRFGQLFPELTKILKAHRLL